MKNIDLNDVRSILELKNIYIKEFNFERTEHNTDEEKTQFYFGKDIEKISEDIFCVLLSAKIHTSMYELTLTIAGNFSIEKFDGNEVLIYKNSLAILFPYLRSELTLLTTQPDINPIILPPININNFFDKTHE